MEHTGSGFTSEFPVIELRLTTNRSVGQWPTLAPYYANSIFHQMHRDAILPALSCSALDYSDICCKIVELKHYNVTYAIIEIKRSK